MSSDNIHQLKRHEDDKSNNNTRLRGLKAAGLITNHSKNNSTATTEAAQTKVDRNSSFVSGVFRRINRNKTTNSTGGSVTSSNESMTAGSDLDLPVPVVSVAPAVTPATKEQPNNQHRNKNDMHMLIPPVRIDGEVVRDYQYLSLRRNEHMFAKQNGNNNHHRQQHQQGYNNQQQLITDQSSKKVKKITTVVRAFRRSDHKSPLKTLYKDTVLLQQQQQQQQASGVQNNGHNANNNHSANNNSNKRKKWFC